MYVYVLQKGSKYITLIFFTRFLFRTFLFFPLNALFFDSSLWFVGFLDPLLKRGLNRLIKHILHICSQESWRGKISRKSFPFGVLFGGVSNFVRLLTFYQFWGRSVIFERILAFKNSIWFGSRQNERNGVSLWIQIRNWGSIWGFLMTCSAPVLCTISGSFEGPRQSIFIVILILIGVVFGSPRPLFRVLRFLLSRTFRLLIFFL